MVARGTVGAGVLNSILLVLVLSALVAVLHHLVAARGDNPSSLGENALVAGVACAVLTWWSLPAILRACFGA